MNHKQKFWIHYFHIGARYLGWPPKFSIRIVCNVFWVLEVKNNAEATFNGNQEVFSVMWKYWMKKAFG